MAKRFRWYVWRNKTFFLHLDTNNKGDGNMTTPEMARKELNEFLDATGVQAKFLAKKLGWDYSNFIKFRKGQENYSVKRSTQLHNFLTEYKQMISHL